MLFQRGHAFLSHTFNSLAGYTTLGVANALRPVAIFVKGFVFIGGYDGVVVALFIPFDDEFVRIDVIARIGESVGIS